MLQVNEYFDGKVKSIALQTSTLPATVGVMAPGEYRFSTSQIEYVSVISGMLIVKLPSESEWKTIGENEGFTVAANQSFDLKVEVDTAYFCKYE
jgi:uncharacterized protein YaiE (UPF0345 family)